MSLLDGITFKREHEKGIWEKKKFDPMVIPNYGCASFHDRGNVCEGSDEIDKNKLCKKCKSYFK